MTQLDQAALAEIRDALIRSEVFHANRAETASGVNEDHVVMLKSARHALSLLAALAPAATQGGAEADVRREEREWCAAWIEGSPLVLEANRGFIGDCLRAGRTGTPAPATQDAGLAEAARNLLDPTDASAADLWSAINDYAVACGGSPGEHVYGNTRRQRAVAEVENAVRERLRAALDRARTGEAR